MNGSAGSWASRLAGIALLAMTPFAPAQAADRAGDWETRLGIFYQNSSEWDFRGGTTADVDSDTSFFVGLGYHLSDHLELGGNLSFGQIDYQADIVGDEPGESFRVRGDYDATTLLFDATWNFMEGAFSPYASAQAGWSWIDTNIATGPPETGCWWDPWWGYVCANFQDTKSIDGFSYGLEVGARYDFSDQFAVHGGYRMMWVDLDNSSGTPDLDGFRLSFGWKF